MRFRLTTVAVTALLSATLVVACSKTAPPPSTEQQAASYLQTELRLFKQFLEAQGYTNVDVQDERESDMVAMRPIAMTTPKKGSTPKSTKPSKPKLIIPGVEEVEQTAGPGAPARQIVLSADARLPGISCWLEFDRNYALLDVYFVGVYPTIGLSGEERYVEGSPRYDINPIAVTQYVRTTHPECMTTA